MGNAGFSVIVGVVQTDLITSVERNGRMGLI